MNFTFKTEWLTRLSMIAYGGSKEDVISFCNALKAYVEDGERKEATEFADMALEPIIAEMTKKQELHDKLSAAGLKGAEARLKGRLKGGLRVAEAKEKGETKEERSKEERKESREIYTDSVDNTSNNIASVLSPSSVCAEPKIDSAPAAPPLTTFLLNDGSEFAITQDIYDRLARAYPAVDTMQQLREIESWSFANPKLRKTRNGAMRFVNAWFAKEQDKGLVPKHLTRNKAQPRLTAEEIYNLPAINPWEGG